MPSERPARRLVILDDEDRVIEGLPPEYLGVHVDDIDWYAARRGELEREQLDCRRLVGAAATFPSKDNAVAALLAANPGLSDFLETEWTTREQRYRDWLRGGRTGTKPVADIEGDGRFDAFNVTWDLHGSRRVTNWLEALYATVPTSRHWADLSERLPVLEEATGIMLAFPEEADVFDAGAASADQCRAAVDDLLDALERSCGRPGRCPVDEEGVPF